MGPLVSQAQFETVSGFLDRGREAGAKVICGGDAPDMAGFFVNPTVMIDTDEQMDVVKEEIFGPVVTAMPFSGIDDLVSRANNTSYGLAAGVWTSDVGEAHQIAKAIKAGTVWVNCYNVFDAALPFGGYKQSGWGREMGHAALDNYLETKAVCLSI